MPPSVWRQRRWRLRSIRFRTDTSPLPSHRRSSGKTVLLSNASRLCSLHSMPGSVRLEPAKARVAVVPCGHAAGTLLSQQWKRGTAEAEINSVNGSTEGLVPPSASSDTTPAMCILWLPFLLSCVVDSSFFLNRCLYRPTCASYGCWRRIVSSAKRTPGPQRNGFHGLDSNRSICCRNVVVNRPPCC